MSEPVWFGVRHLSPAGAFQLRRLLDQVQPLRILVEGPSDLESELKDLTAAQTVPPVAILAYTRRPPVRSLLYPLAEYSPEYQAALWAKEHGVPCQFMDLPSSVFLALLERREGRAEEENREEPQGPEAVWAALEEQAGEDGHEVFWERTLEHAMAEDAYRQGAAAFGARLRELTAGQGEDWPETVLRESWMRRCIDDVLREGIPPERLVVVTGAFHVEGLKSASPMTDREKKRLPRVDADHTLMPYSFYRLSSRSGYGAGNRAPAYYALLWEGMNRDDPLWHARAYLARVARQLREEGSPVSSAEVIEGVRLSRELAVLRGGALPALRDLRDAAITCLGGGNLAVVSRGVAAAEIGTAIGSLPEGVSRTSIQEDFYRQMKDLRLERFRSAVAQDLSLDLRENRAVKSRKSAFLDLNRSFFLHRLRVLDVSFAQVQDTRQENATWAEHWVLCWTPEAEIALVEGALRGDTVQQAAGSVLKERVERAAGMGEVAAVLEDAFSCGLGEAVRYATAGLQAMAVDAASLDDLAAVAQRLSLILQYGGLRQLDPEPLKPILEQIFLRCCLILPGACVCDDEGAKRVQLATERLNTAALAHDFLDSALWTETLRQMSQRDDLNPKLSGYATAVLLERGQMDEEALDLEVRRRLSPGVPADLGAGWFEGLAQKNRYALIARLSLWSSLSAYLDGLDEEEFKRSLVFLRRAFADFTAGEKDAIAENLGEIWGIHPQLVSEQLNAALDGDLLAELADFDFGDF